MTQEARLVPFLLTASTAFFTSFLHWTEKATPPKKLTKPPSRVFFYFIFNSQTRMWLSDNNLDICQRDNQTEKVLWVCKNAATSGVEIAGGLPNTAEPQHCKGISSFPFLKQFGIKGWKKAVCERDRGKKKKERERDWSAVRYKKNKKQKKAENFNFYSFFKANTQYPKNRGLLEMWLSCSFCGHRFNSLK